MPAVLQDLAQLEAFNLRLAGEPRKSCYKCGWADGATCAAPYGVCHWKAKEDEDA